MKKKITIGKYITFSESGEYIGKVRVKSVTNKKNKAIIKGIIEYDDGSFGEEIIINISGVVDE